MQLLRDHFSAIVIAVALLLCALLHSCATRYSHCDGMWSIDHWTGSVRKR